jgi:hypothetical protein
MARKTQTWVFYYQTNRYGDKIVIGTRDCKTPERTALRKEQLTYFHKNNVVCTGYTTELDDPMLVYPQSNNNKL